MTIDHLIHTAIYDQLSTRQVHPTITEHTQYNVCNTPTVLLKHLLQ